MTKAWSGLKQSTMPYPSPGEPGETESFEINNKPKALDACRHGPDRKVTEMNTHVMIPAFLLAFACPLLMAADAKLDDHGAGHAAPAAQAKPAEPKPADKHAADAKHTADAKPAADAKVAEAHPEESAKAPPKKKQIGRAHV